MPERRWREWEPAAVLAVTALGALLRFIGYGDAPAFTDNADEVQFSWAGLNLLAHGDAYTWSYFKSYPHPVTIHAYGTSYPMVHHWMDHPPGFSLLMGAWLWITGSHDPLALTPERVRFLPVLFAVCTIPLGYLAVRRALGAWPALFGTVLLATAPGAVLLSRQAEPESVLGPLLLGSAVLADSLGRCTGRRFPRWQVGLLLLAVALAPTFKITGLAVGGAAWAILVVHNRPRLAGAVLGAAIVGGLLYPLYGWLVDWRLFQSVVQEQSQNRTGLLAGYEMVAAPAGVNRVLRDGWWILGWIALGWIALLGRRSRAELVLAWPAFGYLAVVTLLAGEDLAMRYGWYRLILLPEVMLAAGILAWRGFASPALSRLAVLMVLGGTAATNWWLAGSGREWVIDPALGVVLLALVLVPAAVTAAPRYARHRAIARGLAGGAMVVMVGGNIAESLQLSSLLDHL